MRDALVAFVAVALLSLTGCASTPQASLTSDADAKEFSTAPNAAMIYIYRPLGAGRGVSTLWVDGRLVGESLPQSFFRVAVRPGVNLITTSGNDSGRLQLKTEPNGIYFVEARVDGETQSEASTRFRQVSADTGKQTVEACCRLLENWRPGQSRFNF